MKAEAKDIAKQCGKIVKHDKNILRVGRAGKPNLHYFAGIKIDYLLLSTSFRCANIVVNNFHLLKC